jgi:hypothetical protein
MKKIASGQIWQGTLDGQECKFIVNRLLDGGQKMEVMLLGTHSVEIFSTAYFKFTGQWQVVGQAA